jgi:hypothetical protein
MELLLVVAVKFAKNLDDVGISVSATEDIAGAVETKNEFDMFVDVNSLLNMRIGSVGHLGNDWTYTRIKRKWKWITGVTKVKEIHVLRGKQDSYNPFSWNPMDYESCTCVTFSFLPPSTVHSLPLLIRLQDKPLHIERRRRLMAKIQTITSPLL